MVGAAKGKLQYVYIGNFNFCKPHLLLQYFVLNPVRVEVNGLAVRSKHPSITSAWQVCSHDNVDISTPLSIYILFSIPELQALKAVDLVLCQQLCSK